MNKSFIYLPLCARLKYGNKCGAVSRCFYLCEWTEYNSIKQAKERFP